MAVGRRSKETRFKRPKGVVGVKIASINQRLVQSSRRGNMAGSEVRLVGTQEACRGCERLQQDVCAQEYCVDCYGHFASIIENGLPSDRFLMN
jgi:hypothetical protein